MRSSALSFLVPAICFLLLLYQPQEARGRTRNTAGGDTDSLLSASRLDRRTLTSAELERRIAARRALQRRGYVEVLHGVSRGDILEALFSYARMRLQLEFFLPHDQVYLHMSVITPPPHHEKPLPGFTTFGSGTMPIPLHEDWSYPPDPWRKE